MIIPQIIATTLLKFNVASDALQIRSVINENGTVSITAPQGYSSSFYREYYTSIGKTIQHFIQPIDNSYLSFKAAPSKTQIMVNFVPTYPLPENHDELRNMIDHIIFTNANVQIEEVRCLNPHSTMNTTSLVISVNPEDAEMITAKRILMYNMVTPCNIIWTSSRVSQCTLYLQYGHPSTRCKN